MRESSKQWVLLGSVVNSPHSNRSHDWPVWFFSMTNPCHQSTHLINPFNLFH